MAFLRDLRTFKDWMQSTEFGITNAACSILLKRITAESPAEEAAVDLSENEMCTHLHRVR